MNGIYILLILSTHRGSDRSNFFTWRTIERRKEKLKHRISNSQENWDFCTDHVKLNYTGSLLWYAITKAVSPAPIWISHISYRQRNNILQAVCCVQRNKANGGQWDKKSCKLVIAESSARLAVDTKSGWENKGASLLQHHNYLGCRISFRWASWWFSLGSHVILGWTFCGMNSHAKCYFLILFTNKSLVEEMGSKYDI